MEQNQVELQNSSLYKGGEEQFYQDIELFENLTLGKGIFGQVVKGKIKESNEEVAVRQIYTNDSTTIQAFKYELESISLLSNNQHPNIIQCKCFYFDNFRKFSQQHFSAMIVFPLCPNNLYKVIEEKTPFNEENIILLLQECLNGLDYFQKNLVSFNRALSPKNILITRSNHYAISDFGSSKINKKNQISLIQIRLQNKIEVENYYANYLSPELYQYYLTESYPENEEFDHTKNDLFSLALIALQLYCRLDTVEQLNNGQQGQHKINQLLQKISRKAIQTTLKGMLELNQKNRFTIQQSIINLENELKNELESLEQSALQPNIAENDQSQKLYEQEVGTVKESLLIQKTDLQRDGQQAEFIQNKNQNEGIQYNQNIHEIQYLKSLPNTTTRGVEELPQEIKFNDKAGQQSIQNLFRVSIVGESGVGKSQIFLRLIKNDFESKTNSTIGMEYASRIYVIKKEYIKLQLWDTSGQEKYRAMSKAYYRGAKAVVIVYDITDRQSFEKLDSWLNEARNIVQSDILGLVMGNKTDIGHLRQVSTEEGIEYAKNRRLQFCEVSAKDCHNIQLAFQKLVELIYLSTGKNSTSFLMQNQNIELIKNDFSNEINAFYQSNQNILDNHDLGSLDNNSQISYRFGGKGQSAPPKRNAKCC